MKNLAIALGLVLVIAPSALATVIEVPVPELAGTYSCANPPFAGCSRTATIHLPAIPAVIRSVSLRVQGTSRFARFVCDIHPDTLIGGLFISTELLDAGTSGNYWLAEQSFLTEGGISFTQPFQPAPYTNSTWTFLLDGTANLNFRADGSSPIPECMVAGQADLTTIDSVALLVDGDFPTPVVRRSWGHLKAIYR